MTYWTGHDEYWINTKEVLSKTINEIITVKNVGLFSYFTDVDDKIGVKNILRSLYVLR